MKISDTLETNVIGPQTLYKPVTSAIRIAIGQVGDPRSPVVRREVAFLFECDTEGYSAGLDTCSAEEGVAPTFRLGGRG